MRTTTMTTMRALAFTATAWLVTAAAGCASDASQAACEQVAECGGDVSACISDREAHLYEIGFRCGAASDAAKDVYACQSALTCDEREPDAYAAACADELAAYDAAVAAGGGGCEGAPEPAAP